MKLPQYCNTQLKAHDSLVTLVTPIGIKAPCPPLTRPSISVTDILIASSKGRILVVGTLPENPSSAGEPSFYSNMKIINTLSEA